MAIIDDADIQVHLPVDVLKIEELPDDLIKCKLDTERIVRGTLAGVIPSADMALWIDPIDVPEIVRAAAGRICAALIYRLRFGTQLGDPEYAQSKYEEGMGILQGIIDGTILVDGVAQSGIDSTWFEPNDDSTDPPKFLMSGRF